MNMRSGTIAILLGLMLVVALAAPVGAADQRPMTGQFTAQAGRPIRGAVMA